MKISFITTVFNEAKTIRQFFDSLLSQSILPKEVVIVDGGSTDETVEKLRSYVGRFMKKKVKLTVFVKRGNRSVGRNEAIKHATGDIIVCSDSGNILDKNWIKNITKPFMDKKVDVVAGYYQGKATTLFQKCLVPYVLVMPDKANPDTFLPATRSVAFTKRIWKKVGGFDERLSHNEDYAFAKQLKKIKANIVFAHDAIVYWLPRKTFREAFIMFFRFALGDAETGIWRTKVFLLFARYFLAGYVVFLGFAFQSNVPFVVLFFALFAYLFWSVRKHARYVTAKRSLTILPRLQFTADIAVLAGTVIGIVKFLFRFIKEQKIVSGCIALYIGFVVSVLSWGVPNNLHPFTYHMDEWHQLMALKAMVKHGTTTIAGSAEIPFVYPLLSGLYLIPFVLFHFIDPFSLKSPVENVVMQGRLFEILRSVNILFGVGSMILVAKIARDYLKSNGALAVVFFSVTPIFLLLSTYFKYDICLLFWIILSIFLMLRFGKYPTLKNYLLAAGASGIAMGTKFSAIPLLPLLLFAYFWFLPKKRNAFKDISLGLMVYGVIFLLVGVPSVFIGTANYGPLLYSNLIDSPSTTNNLILQSHWFTYLVGNQYPLLFGHSALLLTACASFVILYFVILKKRFGGNENKAIIFLFVCFILFFISLLPLKIWATRNRALVLLPFLALLSSWFIAYIYTKGQKIYKYGFLLVIVGLLVVQIYETGAWLYAKYRVDIQKESSLWIEKHIAKGTTIGVEEIVLYQGLPNIIEKEFYLEQYKKPHNNKYRYEIMTSDMHTLPAVVVITDADVSRQLYRQASKNDVLKRLERDGYKKKKEFVPDVSYLLRFTDTISYYLAGNAANPTSITIYTKE